MSSPKENYISLPRGGYLVRTSAGAFQIGLPPETIKDTMLLEDGVPQFFVIADDMFDWGKGISIAEVEFPIFFNFFIKKRKTYIICSENQYRAIRNVLQESVFGPKELDISTDYFNTENKDIPTIAREMTFFRNNLKLSDLVAFGIFNKGRFTYRGITVAKSDNGHFEVFDQGKHISDVPAHIDYNIHFLLGERLPEPYIPPLFGITCLGPSHGFDPSENTSGFIIWLNHLGIMVDPPVNSTEWLEDSNVNPKLIDSIILTHCHSDHDAGTFQKILEETKVTIYATETVMMSFLRKYSAVTGVPVSSLMSLFNFHPVKIGRPVFIHGARFMFSYTLHSIPTLSFRMEYQDQSFVYSSDHCNDPSLHKKLLEEKVISPSRYDELSSFPWDSRIIYHESGIPPLHTPINYLDSLPEHIKRNMVIYHIAKKDFPKETQLTLAKFGIENTLYFDTAAPRFVEASHILGLLKHIDIFGDMPVTKAQEFLDIVEEERFSKGESIIAKGTKGDRFFIIYRGNVSVDSGGSLAQRKIYGTYDYFGEVALVTDQNRVADVTAETDVIAYTIERNKFLNFIVGTEFEKMLLRLAKIRSSETWNLLSASSFFKYCTATQKTWLESIFIPIELKKPGILVKEDSLLDFIYIIRSGTIRVTKAGIRITELSRGDFIGTMQEITKETPSSFSFEYDGPVSVFAMKKQDIVKFARQNPGIMMKQVYSF